MDKRIIEETPSTEVLNDDWLIKDSPTNGTSKILGSDLKNAFTGDIEDSIDKILDSIATEWRANESYSNGTYVMYEGELYVCFVNGSTVGQFKKNTEWLHRNVNSMVTKVIRMIAQRFYASTVSPPSITPYSKGDLVWYSQPYHEDELYICKQDLPNGDTEWVPEHWDKVTDISGLSKYLMDKIAEAGQIDDVQVKTIGDYESVVDENKVAKIDLSNKVDKDGMYNDLFAGNLTTESGETDTTSYLYRLSPSGSKVFPKIVGGTVAWNQLVRNGNFENTTRWDFPSGTFSVSNNIGTFTAQSQGQQVTQIIPYKLNHKYLGIAQIKTTTATESVWLRFYGQNKVHTTATTNWQTVATIVNSIVDSTNSFGVRDDRTSSWDAIQIKNANLFDLTQMFGSTIADYIYSLEQTLAGSGIAWLKSYGFLTKDYYPYDAGSLQSVNVASRKVVGRNLFYMTNDNKLNAYLGSTKIESANNHTCYYFPCLPNTSFTISKIATDTNGRLGIAYTYEEPQINTSIYGVRTKSGDFVVGQKASLTTTTDTNAKYIVVWAYWAYGSDEESKDSIQLEIGTTATAYEPYIKHTYPLDSDLTLRGILKLDANNNLYYDGDIYASDGSVTRRYGVVDMGSLTWSLYDGIFYANVIGKAYLNTNANMICECYPVYATNAVNVNDAKTKLSDGEMCGFYRSSGQSTASYVYIKDSNYSTTTELATALNGKKLCYELATPTSETADAYENPQLVGSTEEFIDTRDIQIPVGQESFYMTDLKSKLEELAKIPDVPSTNGTYTLKATRSASGVAYSWVSG